MADVKISELTALTTPDGAEELVVNDGGTTKKITITNATSASLPKAGGTMTGALNVQHAASAVAKFQSTATNGGYVTYVGGSTTYIGAPLSFLGTGTASDFGIIGTGSNNFVLGTSSAEKVRINAAGNLGVGTSASNAKLEVAASSGEVFRADAAGGAYRIVANQDGVLMNGNVGIGNSDPNALEGGFNDLVVGNTSGGHGITIQAQNNSNATLSFADDASGYSGHIKFDHSSNAMDFMVADVEKLSLTAATTIFNEGGTDVDFRVESDANANMLFVDASANMVAIGGGSKVANEVLRSNGAQVVGTGPAGLYTVAINQSFAASASKYLRIQIDNNLFGALTITATGNYSSLNAIGVFQKVYSVGINSSNTSIYSAGNTTTVDLGTTSANFSMGTPTKPDATTYYVPLANTDASYTIDMSIVVEVRGYIEGISSIDIIAA